MNIDIGKVALEKLPIDKGLILVIGADKVGLSPLCGDD